MVKVCVAAVVLLRGGFGRAPLTDGPVVVVWIDGCPVGVSVLARSAADRRIRVVRIGVVGSGVAARADEVVCGLFVVVSGTLKPGGACCAHVAFESCICGSSVAATPRGGSVGLTPDRHKLWAMNEPRSVAYASQITGS